ncbi:MAG: MATE family efflux transporter [Candidatus Competibacteraceae bacterium]
MLNFPSHLWVALSNWIARGVAVVVQLVTIPMLTRALGQEQFGAYAVTVSLLGWFILLDLGLGNALQNFISESRVKGKNAGSYIAVVFLVSGVILCIGSVLVLWLSPIVARFLFAQMPFISPQTGKTLVFISGLFFLCNAVGTIGIKMLYALGQGVYANLITMGMSLFSLVTLWLVVAYVTQQQLLFATIIAYAAPLGLIGLAVTVVLFIKCGMWQKPAIIEAARQLFPRARGFWLFSLLAPIVLNVDYLIMSQKLPPEEIAKYNILFRIFWVFMSLYSGLLTATWPVWAEFAAGNEWPKVRRHLRLYLSLSLSAVFLFTIAMVFVLPHLVSFFLPGKETVIAFMTILLFGLYIGIRAWTDTYAIALQAANDTGVFLRWVPVEAAINISAQWVLSQIFGLNGIMFGLILAYLTTVTWVLPMRLSAHIKAAVVK